MHTIEIEFDVFKALTNLRESETVTYNEVIRRLLNLPELKSNDGKAVGDRAPTTSSLSDLTSAGGAAGARVE